MRVRRLGPKVVHVEALQTAALMTLLLAASPLGAWYTLRHPAVRNDSWGGALGLFLSWVGFAIAVGYCAWRARQVSPEMP